MRLVHDGNLATTATDGLMGRDFVNLHPLEMPGGVAVRNVVRGGLLGVLVEDVLRETGR